MKKMYVFLILTTILSVSGAEMVRQKAVQFVPQSITPIAEISANHWDTLNNLMDPHSMHSQPIMSYCDTGPTLMTIYKQPTQSSSAQATKDRQKETKPLLRTNPSRCKIDIMEELRQKVYPFILDETGNKRLNQKSQGKALTRIIRFFNNNARPHGINEDMMAQYTFDNREYCAVYCDYAAYRYIAAACVPLFFSLLKTFNLMVDKTKEQLPFEKRPRFNEIFKASSNTQPNTITDIYVGLTKIPAFLQFQYAIRHMLQEYDSASIDIFFYSLYKNAAILRENFSGGSYGKNLKNAFCNQAYNVLLGAVDAQKIYQLLQIIDTAKNNKHIENETDLGYKILDSNFTPTLSVEQHIVNFFNDPLFFLNDPLFFLSEDSVANLKNRIALFCILAQEYNQNRGTKDHPTGNQYHAYNIKKNFNITLPDSCTNQSFFDENQYAFEEFRQLIQKTKRICDDAKKKRVEAKVKELYPQEK